MPQFKYTNERLALSRDRMHAIGFSVQPDVTVGTEVLPPPFGTINEIVKALNLFWSEWLDTYPNQAPLFKGSGFNDTIGGHHHLGLRHRKLTESEGLNVIKHLVNIYPFTNAIMANDYSSGRGNHFASARNTHNSRVTPISDSVLRSSLTDPILPTDHYDELHYVNSIGTIELRRYDSNIPQAHLAVAFIEKPMIAAAVAGEHPPPPPTRNNRSEEMGKSIIGALENLDYQAYWKWWLANYEQRIIQALEEEKGLLADSVKEILLMASKGITPQSLALQLDIYGSKSKEFDYFRSMVSNSGAYLQKLKELGYSIPASLQDDLEFSTQIKSAIKTYVPDFSNAPDLVFKTIMKWRESGFSENQIETRLNVSKGLDIETILKLDRALMRGDTDSAFTCMSRLRSKIPLIRKIIVELYPKYDSKIPRNCVIGSIFTPSELEIICSTTGIEQSELLRGLKYQNWLLMDEDDSLNGKRTILGFVVTPLRSNKILYESFSDSYGKSQMSDFLNRKESASTASTMVSLEGLPNA